MQVTEGAKGRWIRWLTLWATAIALWAAGNTVAYGALAGTAGNTIIRNKVEVSYRDGGNTGYTTSSTATVTVNTINAAPSIFGFDPSPGGTSGTGATREYTFWVRTNSNGPGTINLSAADGSLNNIAAGTAPSVTAPASFFLGATVIDPTDAQVNQAQNIAIGASIAFAVPNDGGIPTDSATSGGATENNIINALAVDDRVYIYDGTIAYGPFKVTNVQDPPPGDGDIAATGSITLENISDGAISFTPQAGWMLTEAKQASMTVTQGEITDRTQLASWVTTVTGDMGGQTGTGIVTTNATIGALTVLKEVSTNGTNFAATANAPPKTELTYRIIVTNTGTGAASTVSITDSMPPFVTYKSGTAKAKETPATTDPGPYSDGDLSELTDAETVDDGFDFGVTQGNQATYTRSTLDQGRRIHLFFQAEID